MEFGRLTPGWFRILVGDTIDNTEVRGWRKTGRPNQMNPSFTELRTVRCIIHGPESDEIYKIAEASKSSFLDRTLELPLSELGETMKSPMRHKLSDTTIKEIVLGVNLSSQTQKEEVIEALSDLQGIQSIHVDTEGGRLTVIGDLDPVNVVNRVSKIETAHIISVGPAKEATKRHKTDGGPAYTSTSSMFGSRSTITDDRLS
ncbi:hypothetical protein L2E82_51264 [Cichorium intybus]|nr:hypothetical protein L2E82_51264 [Cichorium intybus]